MFTKDEVEFLMIKLKTFFPVSANRFMELNQMGEDLRHSIIKKLKVLITERTKDEG